MIVDDDPMVRKVLVRTLARLGYTIIEASNGTDALELLVAACGAVDVLVSDAIMPFAGGEELVMEARARFPELKIVLMSGQEHTDTESVANVFMHKPFLPRELAATIRSMIDGR
jgi:two-component system cell cycle sensor histidine kinase/response regulator CckA